MKNYRLLIVFISFLMLPVLSQGTNESKESDPSVCFEAYDECASKCSSSAFYNLKYVFVSDLTENCERACKKGGKSCNSAPALDKCSRFEKKCQKSCPSDIFDYSTDQYIFISDAKELCDKACTKGADICELN